MTPLLRNIEIVGNFFRDPEAKEVFADLHVGEELELAHDDENEHDDHAVAVFARDVHVGYVPAIASAALLYLASKHELVVGLTKVDGKKRFMSVGIEAE